MCYTFVFEESNHSPFLEEKDLFVEMVADFKIFAEFIEIETDYIQDHYRDMTVISKKGSLYLLENEKEKMIKKFYGLYSSKFTGYQPIGFSPDGKYLVYLSKEHLTSIGSLLDEFINGSFGNMYIMDLSTMESSKFINSYSIQWVMD